MKECIDCKVSKDIAYFYKHTGTRIRGDCKDCFDFKQAASKYGLTSDQLKQLYINQGGKCAICGEECSVYRNLSVDHDHSCCPGKRACGKCVRGLLCAACNQAIGLMRNDPKRLQAAINYLS